MNTLKLLAGLLAVALVVSVGLNVHFWGQNAALNDQKNTLTNENRAQAARLDMVSTLFQAQVKVNAELQKIGANIIYASEQLSAIGIDGVQTRSVLSELVANSSFIIDAATADLNNTLVTVEPSAHRNVEGMYIGEQDYLNTNSRNPIIPTMTDVIPLVEGFDGAAIVAPIFNQNGTIIGSVSVIFDPTVLLNAKIAPLVKDKAYSVTAMQLNSRSIYDTDPAQIGKVLFTDPLYASYTELLALGHNVAEESSGYGTYSFPISAGSTQAEQKECYWTTIGAYGTEWRLALIHTMNA